MTRCPTCDSPDPMRHPAMQYEGEVQICKDSFHPITRHTITDEQIRELRESVGDAALAGDPMLRHMLAVALGEIVDGGWLVTEGGLVPAPASTSIAVRRRGDARALCVEILNARATQEAAAATRGLHALARRAITRKP